MHACMHDNGEDENDGHVAIGAGEWCAFELLVLVLAVAGADVICEGRRVFLAAAAGWSDYRHR